MFLQDEVQRTLRELGKINNEEVVKKQGDIYIAINLKTAENRILVNETTLIESLTRDIPNQNKQLLKG
tara:strand:+ start:720 stop:923 length:204 start_codon:yes stop_codon:yes gene_type:complete